MTESSVVYTNHPDSSNAGRALGLQIKETMQGQPDVVILFAAPTYDQVKLLEVLKQTCSPALLVGCSSAGEFTNKIYGEGTASAVALRSEDITFSLGVGRDLSKNQQAAAEAVVSTFQGNHAEEQRHRSAIVLTDALAGLTDELVEQLTLFTAGAYQFFGGGAGDNAQFSHTPVFYDTEVVSGGVVALEMLSKKPIGIGVRHGWRPASESLFVTEANGMHIVSIDGEPAIQAFQEYALATGQTLDINNPLPFFLHNLIGIDTGAGHRLRVPLAFSADGSVLCAAEVPARSRINIMQTSSVSAAEAAVSATGAALQNLYGSKPAVALFFDCVATRLRMGYKFGYELDAVKNKLAPIPYVGCNSHGQIARAEGQFSGFHNCTAVVCVIPE